MTIPGDNTGGKPPKRERPPLRVAGQDGRDDRPDILLTAEVHKTTADMIHALTADGELYQRGGQLVHVVHAESDGRGRSRGTPLVRACPLSFLRGRVSQYARCLTKDKAGNWKPASPPTPEVKAVLEHGAWPGIRPLAGVVEAPSMRPDGSLIQVPGYDEETRTLYEPNATYPLVPEEPTESDAVLAYAHLAEVFADFPYINESHRSATVAAILTIIARPAILGAVPCWLFDAANKRSGKSLQVNVVSILATGRPAPVMTFPDKDEELEKVLAGFALSGARIVNFDNVARPFGGAALDKCITAVDSVQLRVLGTMEMPILPWRAIVLASGNQVTAKGDMLPRVLSPRIESPLEQPETRTDYTRPERAGEDRMCAWAMAHRPELVVAGLTLLRAYMVAGRPRQPIARWGGFSAWTDLVAAALVWAGAPDPMGARRGNAEDDDPKARAERALVLGWRQMCGDLGVEELTLSGAVAHLYPPPRKDEPPDGCDDLREAIQELTGAKAGFAPPTDRLGRALRSLRNRPLGGMKLTSTGTTGKVARWRVVASK